MPRREGAPGAAVRSRAWTMLATSTIMARTTGGLFLLGGALGVAVTTQMPDGPGNRMAVYAAAIAAVGFGIALLLLGDRVKPVHHQILVAIATALITVAVLASTSGIAALSIGCFYVFIACDAAFFFAPAWAVLHTVLAAVCSMIALGLRPELSWWAGLVPAGATIGVGAVVAVLSRLAAGADADVLTGLLNRRGFDHALNAELARAGRSGARPALVLIDLDGFKDLNDREGHRSGDRLLQQVADTWQALIGPDDMLARYGGDEFALLLPGCDEQGAAALAEELRAAITVGCSAGVTSWQPGESASMVVSRADIGLYRAKQSGRNRTIVESTVDPPLTTELRLAIRNGDIEVHYQPIVSLHDEAAVGIEALVRWKPVSRPDLTPAQVIRMAEQNGLIAALDHYVLWRACADAKRLQRIRPDQPLTLNVNVSGLELAEPDFACRVDNVLHTTGWPATQLVLEVTESVLAADAPEAVDTLNTLRERGIRIAIDDFGTGYSSLSRLGTLPSDILKVDRSFIDSIAAGAPAPAMLGGIVSLGRALRLPLIAEGVENAYQARVLAMLGYPLAQGFHYGRPQTADALAELLSGTADSDGFAEARL